MMKHLPTFGTSWFYLLLHGLVRDLYVDFLVLLTLLVVP